MVLAGRGLPLGIGVITMTATWVGGGYLSGTAEATYSGGLWRAQAPWGYALSLVFGGLCFAPTMRRLGFTTMLDPFERRYLRGYRWGSVCHWGGLVGSCCGVLHGPKRSVGSGPYRCRADGIGIY